MTEGTRRKLGRKTLRIGRKPPIANATRNNTNWRTVKIARFISNWLLGADGSDCFAPFRS
jgi:hypothetical protein